NNKVLNKLKDDYIGKIKKDFFSLSKIKIY
ncbi:unnamed protein product, partial [marine sediment metagenome]